MATRAQQLATAIVGIVVLTVGVVVWIFVAPHLPASLRWLGIPFVVIGLINLALIPRFAHEKVPADDEFVDLAQGQAVRATPQVQRLALALDRQLGDLPHRTQIAPNAVRVQYDSADFFDPGSEPRVKFQWETTLSSGGSSTFFQTDRDRRQQRGQSGVMAGKTFGGGFQMTIGADGVTTKTVSRGTDIKPAIKAALAETGCKTGLATMLIVGIVNATLGFVLAGAGLVAALTL